jgi:hypothetical protein
VHFISGLMTHKLPFIVYELGADADPFMLHLYSMMSAEVITRHIKNLPTRNELQAREEERRCRLHYPPPMGIITLNGPYKFLDDTFCVPEIANNSGSLAMFTAMRRASSRVTR